jgi:hypothetical protein
MTLSLANCTKTMTGKSSANATYKVKQEGTNDAILNKVPQWFVDAQIEKGLITNRDAENYIYGVGSGESPDLQMAIDKAVLVAKSNLADQLEGELNKRTNFFKTEEGAEGGKSIASTIDQTIVNIIEKTKVRGYEEWHKSVLQTPNNTYRVYIGLKFGIGDANRLAKYISDNAVPFIDVEKMADEAVDSLVPGPRDGQLSYSEPLSGYDDIPVEEII